MEELRLENDHPCAVPKTLVTEPTSQGTENRPTEVRRRQLKNMAWWGRASQIAEAREWERWLEKAVRSKHGACPS